MAEGGFREDLYYRLNVFPIRLPALRERTDDLEALALHFLARHCEAMGKRIGGFSPAAMSTMVAYSWPGNIRELQNCVERAVILARGSTIEFADLPRYVSEGRPTIGASAASPPDLDAELRRVERVLLTNALSASDGVQARAAALLGITERSMWHRLKKLGITMARGVRE